eukprot:scaffold591_cov176-Amphora_coffeaeformis.AAC.1
MGDPQPNSPTFKDGPDSYKLHGVTEVLSNLPAKAIIDRGYPEYNIPAAFLAAWSNVANYQLFLQHHRQQPGRTVTAFDVGSTTQFTLQYKPSDYDFTIFNLKSNRQVVSEWVPGTSFQDRVVHTIPGDFWKNEEQTKWDENEFSTAFLLRYGDFHYYEGGDQEQHMGFDAITPTAKASGPVDVATANHHGRGTNRAFCELLDPAVVIMQGLFSDQPLVETMEFLTNPRQNGELRKLFVTDIYVERLKAIGPKLGQ